VGSSACAAPGGAVVVAGDPLPDGGERARDLGDEREHPLAQLVEQRSRHPRVPLGGPPDERRPQRDEVGVGDRLDRGRQGEG
jgi:hypothetical protein